MTYKIEHVKISELSPYKNNARTHSELQISQIMASIKEFGFCNPILIDKDSGIIAGHGRVLAAQKLGLDTVPVIVLGHLTENQKRAYILADNKLALNAGWNEEMLAAEIDSLKSDGADLTLLGFDDGELKKMAASLDAGDVSDAEPKTEKAEELQREWKTARGQLWKLGNHRLFCGDSADAKSYAALLGSAKPTIVFTDPPYGVSIGDKNKMLDKFSKADRIVTNIENDTMSVDDLYKLLLSVFKNVHSAIADDCAVYVCSPQNGGLGMMMMMMMRDAGLEARHVLIWVKNSPCFSMGRLDYDYQHEPILFTWKKTHKRIGGGQFKTSTWSVNKPRACDLHPTMKPIELPENAILNSSDAGDAVLDCFCGSGTTILAAEKTGRVGYGIELDPKYCAVILQRYKDATGKTPELQK